MIEGRLQLPHPSPGLGKKKDTLRQLPWDKWNILKKLSAHPLRSSALSSRLCLKQAVVHPCDPIKASIPTAAESTQAGTSDLGRVHCEKGQIECFAIPGAVHHSLGLTAEELKTLCTIP